MIFKNLFKSKKKWLSDKVSDRLVAVSELDVATNKSILHELAFNDADDKVRRAALEKLNEFSLWWQAFKKDSADNIKRLAEKTLVEAVTGGNSLSLTSVQKHSFVNECNKTNLLEQIVFKLDDESLILSTLSRINKDHLMVKAVTDSSLSADSKKKLLEPIDNLSQLRKLTKKVDAELSVFLTDKIEQLQQAAEKPVKLEKQVRLVLAQLNALKDKSDFQLISEKQADIVSQWQDLNEQFGILSEDVKQELEAKFEAIQGSIGRILAPLEQAWLDAQKAQELVELQQTNKQDILSQLGAIESEVTKAIADGSDIDQDGVANAIQLLTKTCQELELLETDKGELLTRAESLFNRASQVPKIKAAIADAKNIVEQIKQLSVPTNFTELNELSSGYKALTKQWHENKKSLAMALPQEIEDSFNQTTSDWNITLPELEKQQRQQFSQTRRKLSELEELVSAGKYHHAFGLFKKLSFWYEDLNEYQQNQLSRKWQSAQESIDNLHELEKSFSNPKKQELLEDIRKLAEQPLVDPSEQAHRVKMLRSNWQTLGHAGDEQETQLNDEFNNLCEQAFSICRDHYKQLEDERAANYNAKALIVEQLETIAQNLQQQEVSSWKDVESMYVKLTKLYRETGLVDREKVAELSNRFKAATTPIKNAIASHHKDNEATKRQLLVKAKQIAEQDKPVFEVVNELKALQQDWQRIGFAGKNVDQKLWNEFRAINNPVFERRDDEKRQQLTASNEEFEAHKQVLNQAQAGIESASEISQFREFIAQAENETADLKGLQKTQYEKLRKQSAAIVKQAEEKIASLRQQQEKQIYVDLFAAVEALAQGKSTDMSSLKPAWQSALNFNNKEDRADVTLMLELTAGVDSPELVKEQRNQIQMTMLSAKMEQGVDYSLQELLETWLSAGMFEQQDIELLQRVKPIFLH